MRKTLTYYMWGSQQHFRSSLQLETKRVLEQIGLPAKPRALLVGFAASDDAAWPICVEPESRFFQPAHLDGVVERAREIYENNPNHRIRHSDPRIHELYHQSLVDSCRAEAVVEALDRNAPEPVTYFAGHSTRVGDYEVHPAYVHLLADDLPDADFLDGLAAGWGNTEANEPTESPRNEQQARVTETAT
jgi:hypothetical protein